MRSCPQKAARSTHHYGNVQRPAGPQTASAVDGQPGRDPTFCGGFVIVKDFLKTSDFERGDLEHFLAVAKDLKGGDNNNKPLAGRSVALVFFNPSLRTRASMQVGIYELGGNPVILEPGGTSWTLEYREGVVMDGDKTEHLAEFVRVLERYVSAIGVRTFAELKNWETERTDPVLNAFSKYAAVPVINLESAMHH